MHVINNIMIAVVVSVFIYKRMYFDLIAELARAH
jgi:hypothetical protein